MQPMLQSNTCEGSQFQRTRMNRYKDARDFADNLIYQYATRTSEYYDLQLSDLPDFEQYEFAMHVLNDSSDTANESTGCDNPAYEKTMLPALLKHLQDITNKDNEIEFAKAWREGTMKYCEGTMELILEEQLTEAFNESSIPDPDYYRECI